MASDLQVTTIGGENVSLPLSAITCISSDDDLEDVTLLLLTNDSMLRVAEPYEDVVDRIREHW